MNNEMIIERLREIESLILDVIERIEELEKKVKQTEKRE